MIFRKREVKRHCDTLQTVQRHLRGSLGCAEWSDVSRDFNLSQQGLFPVAAGEDIVGKLEEDEQLFYRLMVFGRDKQLSEHSARQ